MTSLRAAVIGAGRPRRTEGCTGYGMGHFHARGYQSAPDCELVAVADIKKENATAFAQEHPGTTPYTDHHEMLKKERPDMVSVCLWDRLHFPITMDCIAAGVKAVHCEKPMAPTFGEARRMAEAARDAGVQLTFNHEMRFGRTVQEVKRRIDAGEIGALVRMEAFFGNLFDEGTHWFDLMFLYNGEEPAEWVIGQIDSRTEREVFGVRHEDQSLAHFRFRNGVEGLAASAARASALGGANSPPFSRLLRLIGAEATMEMLWGPTPDQDCLRLRRENGGGWETLPLSERLMGPDMLHGALSRGIHDAIEALRTGRTPLLDARYALQATELIFAIYESSRRRARIDLPLDIEDSPFLTMLEKGEIGPGRGQAESREKGF